MAPTPLIYSPANAQSYAQAIFQSHKLLPENAGRSRLSLKAKAGIFFRRTTLPRFAFKCCSTLPLSISLGSTPSFTLNLIPDMETSTAPLPDSVVFESCSITVHAVTIGRVPKQEQYIVRENKSLSFHSFAWSYDGGERCAYPLFDQSNGYTLTTVLPVPMTGFAPTFMTYNIARFYTLKATWSLKCAGDSVRVVSETPLLVFHAVRSVSPPSCSLTSLDGYHGNEGATPFSGQRSEAGPSCTLALPSYADAVQSDSVANTPITLEKT